MFKNVDSVMKLLGSASYLTDSKTATCVYLARKLNKPLLVEGPAGVGKTELGKAIAQATESELIRLQCYEGLDEAKALYEWNYQKQLLCIQSFQDKSNLSWRDIKENIYTPEFILARPLLKAFTSEKSCTLLIDELDKSDDEFESFLLEALSDYQVSIPEYGVIKATSYPFVILTSNNQRQLSDAIKRRCIYLYIDYPDHNRELDILNMKIPDIDRDLAQGLVSFVQSVRKLDLRKAPSVAETLDWAKALLILGKKELDKDTIQETMSLLIKYQADVKKVEKKILGL
ncbi:MAG: ATPase [Desulfitibacter sp. BRH_c19]|nr:MAG: ATPase [Desulfitibacter sp. BRH_c19]